MSVKTTVKAVNKWGKKALWVQIRDHNKLPVLKRRRRIGRSKLMTIRMKIYRDRVYDWLREAPVFQIKQCRACVRRFPNHLVHDATQCHHRNGRAGSLLMDERFWMPVCAECHAWIHNHIQDARKIGLICAKGEWNQPVK